MIYFFKTLFKTLMEFVKYPFYIFHQLYVAMTTEDGISNKDSDAIMENIKNVALGKYLLPENSTVNTETIYTQWQFYEMGRRNVIPASWVILNGQLDPEFSEYLRLQEKFKGKKEVVL